MFGAGTSFLAHFAGRVLPGVLFKHSLKTCLLEMVVCSQGFGQPSLSHYGEGDAICQRPVLVWPGLVKVESSLVNSGGKTYDLKHWQAMNAFDRLDGKWLGARQRESIGEFQQDPFCCHD